MDKKEISVEKLADSLGEVLERASDARSAVLQRLAELQDKRAKRLTKLEARLSISLEKEHPRVVALRRAATTANELRHAVGTTAERITRHPKPGPRDWMVTGCVTDKGGNSLSGLRVRVYDKDRIYDDLLGETATDEYGDFSVIYQERDFAEEGEKLPELYVMVSDSDGNLLYSSRENVRFNAGRIEHFEITLPENH